MRLLKGQFLIILIIYASELSCAIYILNDLDSLIGKFKEFSSTLHESKLICSEDPRIVKDLLGDDDESVNRIRAQFYEIHMTLREIEGSMNFEMKKNLLDIAKFTNFLFKSVDELNIFITSIADFYRNFYRIIILDGYFYDRPVENLTELIFPNIESNMQMLRKIMIHPKESLPGYSSLIAAVYDYGRTGKHLICNSYQPISGIINYLMKIAIITEIKANLMICFANLCLSRENKEQWQALNFRAMTELEEYYKRYINIGQQHSDLTTDLYIRACDPEDGAWILNKNYYELDGITQSVVFGYRPSICPFEFCRNIWQKRSTRCDAKYYDTRSSCSSTPTDCSNLGSVKACVLKNGPHKFQYVNSTKVGFMGINAKCPEDNGYIIDNEKGEHSGYVTCHCRCNDIKHNKISLLILESTEDSNQKVIIGLRFKYKNNILHIQPRVGELMANGYIQRNSVSWLQIPNNIDESAIHPVDKENSLFFFDDLILPPNFVLTGVGFNKITKGTVTGFAIIIFGVPFVYESGQLDVNRKMWLTPLKNDSGRPLIFRPVSSIHTEEYNIPSSSDIKYVQLQQSLLMSDFGQSMLPQFDAIPVTTDPPSALSGIGIFHKAVEDYAGFISLRAYGIRFSYNHENFTSNRNNIVPKQ